MTKFFKLKTGLLTIKMKFTIVTIGVSLVSFGIAAVLSTRWLAEEIQDDYKEKATLMWTHIIHDLEDSMIRRVHQDVSRTLDIYKAYKEVEEVRIFNLNGKEVFTQGPASPETKVEEVLRSGNPIQFEKKISHRNVTTFIIPIQNKPVCHGCHGKGEGLRGALLLSLSQEVLERYIGQQKQRFFVLFSLIAMATIVATLIAVRRLFLDPLRSIQAGAEAIKKGNFKYQIPVKSRDEVGTLGEHFNNMAQTLKRYFEEVEDKNKKLVDQLTLVSRSQKEWQETFDCISDPLVVIDNHCTIIRVNQAFQETFKEASLSPQGEMVNKKCDELFGSCLLSNCPHKISMEDKAPTTREIHAQKTGKIFEVSIFPYSPHDGNFIGSVAILKDVTKKKESEMRLIMSERLAALGEVASGIAHEINNPMATIAACAEGLLKRVRTSEVDISFFENYLKIIEEEISRCKNITNHMLSFVREPFDRKQEIDIHEILNESLKMVGFQGRLNNIMNQRNSSGEKLSANGKRGELIQLFRAIILNALDAMGDSGTLTLQTGNDGNSLFVKISDTGCGIPSGLINRIFDPFFTTKSKKGGTGLGLSIAYKIAEENNGKIDVISEEGKGTVFTITLPL